MPSSPSVSRFDSGSMKSVPSRFFASADMVMLLSRLSFAGRSASYPWLDTFAIDGNARSREPSRYTTTRTSYLCPCSSCPGRSTVQVSANSQTVYGNAPPTSP